MALKHAVLSCLSRGAALSGYKLNAVFTDQNERVWHASPSQVYSELLKMERAGLIEAAEKTDRSTSYVITDSGVETLREWLTFTEPDHTVRDDSLLRLMTLWVLDPVTARHLIDAEIAFQRRRRTQLAKKVETYTDDFGDQPVWRNRLATHILWIRQTDLLIEWLEALPEVLESTDVPVETLLDYTEDARSLA